VEAGGIARATEESPPGDVSPVAVPTKTGIIEIPAKNAEVSLRIAL